MNEKLYLKIVEKHKPKEPKLKNSIIAFIVGGLIGALAQILVNLYMNFDMSFKDSCTLMIVTIIFIGVLLTGIGIFDKMVSFCKCGLIIPITGFAHSMMSAVMDHKKDGFISGIGSNIFKLSGTVIAYGVISSSIFGFIRLLIGG